MQANFTLSWNTVQNRFSFSLNKRSRRFFSQTRCKCCVAEAENCWQYKPRGNAWLSQQEKTILHSLSKWKPSTDWRNRPPSRRLYLSPLSHGLTRRRQTICGTGRPVGGGATSHHQPARSRSGDPRLGHLSTARGRRCGQGAVVRRQETSKQLHTRNWSPLWGRS